MARDQLTVMRHFGFHRFGLIGHDRGARVGYRLVLDHPDTVQAFVSLTVIPSAEMWARASKAFGLGAYHWSGIVPVNDSADSVVTLSHG